MNFKIDLFAHFSILSCVSLHEKEMIILKDIMKIVCIISWMLITTLDNLEWDLIITNRHLISKDKICLKIHINLGKNAMLNWIKHWKKLIENCKWENIFHLKFSNMYSMACYSIECFVEKRVEW